MTDDLWAQEQQKESKMDGKKLVVNLFIALAIVVPGALIAWAGAEHGFWAAFAGYVVFQFFIMLLNQAANG